MRSIGHSLLLQYNIVTVTATVVTVTATVKTNGNCKVPLHWEGLHSTVWSVSAAAKQFRLCKQLKSRVALMQPRVLLLNIISV
jgi:hypothetical protein